MAESRQLPNRRNHMLDNVPAYVELVARRRLGQTQLTPRMVGSGVEVDSATLGVFDYAHLRAPLPRGIVSGVFKSSPGSYFLMRRSSDGYVSSTGMFKATFPWARSEQEDAERKYIKSIPTTSAEETAGNVWIPPEQALDLAEEYGILPWIRALLDPADVSYTAEVGPPKTYRPPPKFFGGMTRHPTSIPQPKATRSSGRTRRSVSPLKPTVGRRRLASPRKHRQPSPSSPVDTPPVSINGSFATLINSESTLVNGEDFGLSPSSTQVTKLEFVDNEIEIESIEKDPDAEEEEEQEEKEEEEEGEEELEEESKPRVHFEEDVEIKQDDQDERDELDNRDDQDDQGDQSDQGDQGDQDDTDDQDDIEVEHTNVGDEVPLFADMPDPEDAGRLLQAAREAVEASMQATAAPKDDESVKAEASASKDVSAMKDAPASKKSKRKAEDIAKGDNKDRKEGEVAENDEAERRSKKPKTEVEVRKEGMKKRAIYGIAGTIAIG